MSDNHPITPEEQRMLEIRFRLDEAFRRDPSIGAMNRRYRKLRTGDAETDRAIRDHIGILYLLKRAKPALLQAIRRGGMKGALNRLRWEPVKMEVASG
jgi:hypothetical protein